MTRHLAPAILNALTDGELSTDQLAEAQEHLAGCPSCTSNALAQLMLKSATAKAGRRYTLPSHLQQRLTRQTQSETRSASARPAGRYATLGWATALALLLVSAGLVFVQTRSHQTGIISSESAALVTEVYDQHIATLAANSPPQVISSDRHTVKPWFQGKLPFSFNLPEGLPNDVTLDGANLTYLHGQPVAQLLYSIGRHRVSVFVRQRTGPLSSARLSAERAGFHVIGFNTADLEAVAVSDVDPARLADLVSRIEHAQPYS